MADDSSPNRIDEEMVCIDALVHCLRYQCACNNVTEKRERNDPPDFWVTIEGEKYAVEVTSIVTGQEYSYWCAKLKQSIQESIQRQGSLTGTYALSITRRPRLPKRTSPEWGGLISRAISFMCTTRDSESTHKTVLLESTEGELTLTKIHARGACLGLVGPSGARWEGEVQEELKELIATRITDKRQKLEKKGVPGLCRGVILLLYDAYEFGGVADAHTALLKVDGYDWFHSVFWATAFTDRPNDLSPTDSGGVGKFLYSANKNWCSDPRTRHTQG